MRHQTLLLSFLVILTTVNCSCKKNHQSKIVTIRYSGEQKIGSPISFSTDPALPDAIWQFGDNTASITGLSPSHTFRYGNTGNNFIVSVSASYRNGENYTGSTTIYIPTDAVYYLKKYNNQIKRTRNWHHTAYIHLYNRPDKDDTHFTYNDTNFAYVMSNDTSIGPYTEITKTTDSSIYIGSSQNTYVQQNGPNINMQYNFISDELYFTRSYGSSGNWHTDVFTSY